MQEQHDPPMEAAQHRQELKQADVPKQCILIIPVPRKDRSCQGKAALRHYSYLRRVYKFARLIEPINDSLTVGNVVESPPSFQAGSLNTAKWPNSGKKKDHLTDYLRFFA
jgi:hypothetical protein